MGKALRITIGVFIGACLVAGAVMIAVSFGVLNNNELGLDYDTIAEKLNTDKLYKNGRHFLGLGHKFIVYPALQQSVLFSSATGSSDGPILVRERGETHV
jgi:hypothetical protein